MLPVKKSFLDENGFIPNELKLELLLKLYKTLIQLETRAEDVTPSMRRWDYVNDISRVEKEILKRNKKKK